MVPVPVLEAALIAVAVATRLAVAVHLAVAIATVVAVHLAVAIATVVAVHSAVAIAIVVAVHSAVAIATVVAGHSVVAIAIAVAVAHWAVATAAAQTVAARSIEPAGFDRFAARLVSVGVAAMSTAPAPDQPAVAGARLPARLAESFARWNCFESWLVSENRCLLSRWAVLIQMTTAAETAPLQTLNC